MHPTLCRHHLAGHSQIAQRCTYQRESPERAGNTHGVPNLPRYLSTLLMFPICFYERILLDFTPTVLPIFPLPDVGAEPSALHRI